MCLLLYVEKAVLTAACKVHAHMHTCTHMKSKEKKQSLASAKRSH